MAAPTAARLTRWAEGHHHPDQTKLATDTTKPKGPVSLIVARLRRFNVTPNNCRNNYAGITYLEARYLHDQ